MKPVAEVSFSLAFLGLCVFGSMAVAPTARFQGRRSVCHLVLSDTTTCASGVVTVGTTVVARVVFVDVTAGFVVTGVVDTLVGGVGVVFTGVVGSVDGIAVMEVVFWIIRGVVKTELFTMSSKIACL